MGSRGLCNVQVMCRLTISMTVSDLKTVTDAGLIMVSKMTVWLVFVAELPIASIRADWVQRGYTRRTTPARPDLRLIVLTGGIL